MKKILIICLTIILMVMSCIFVGCQNKATNKEYSVVTLTKDNYDDYISLNFELSDYNLIKLEEQWTGDEYYYTASVLVHIKTSSKVKNCVFQNVLITYNNLGSTIWKTVVTKPKVTLNYDGSSTYSYGATAEHVHIDVAIPSQILTMETSTLILEIEGVVKVPNN